MEMAQIHLSEAEAAIPSKAEMEMTSSLAEMGVIRLKAEMEMMS